MAVKGRAEEVTAGKKVKGPLVCASVVGFHMAVQDLPLMQKEGGSGLELRLPCMQGVAGVMELSLRVR